METTVLELILFLVYYVGIPGVILYFIIKFAVKNALKELIEKNIL